MANRYSFDELPDGSLILTMDGSCIQTAAKRAHREWVTALLEGSEASALCEVSGALLEEFLNTTDFPTLRTGHPELAGGTGRQVRLLRRKDGRVGWEMA